MVSIRRRRLLGLSTGKSSFLASIPKTFDGGQTPENATQNLTPFSMTPVPSIDLDQGKETGISKVHPGSSNVSTLGSSKEQQQFSGDQNITSDGCPNSDAPDSHQNYSAVDADAVYNDPSISFTVELEDVADEEVEGSTVIDSANKDWENMSHEDYLAGMECQNEEAADLLSDKIQKPGPASDLRIDSSAELAEPSLAGVLWDTDRKNLIAYLSSANTHIYLVDGVMTIENSDLQIDLKAISLLRSNFKANRDQAKKLRDDITREVRTNGYIHDEKLRAFSDSSTKLMEELTSLEDQIKTADSELDAILSLLYQRMGENSTK